MVLMCSDTQNIDHTDVAGNSLPQQMEWKRAQTKSGVDDDLKNGPIIFVH